MGDWVVAEVFLREFADVRRDPALQTSSAASFSKNVPGELEGTGEEKQEDKVYISFVLFSKHWKGPMAEKSVSALCMFRNYLHYHIKASKAFMHMRMRKRADDLLQVLNRAKPPRKGSLRGRRGRARQCMRSRLLVVGDECLVWAPGCMPGKAVTSAMQAVTHHSCCVFSVLLVYASLPWNGHGRIWLLPGALLG